MSNKYCSYVEAHLRLRGNENRSILIGRKYANSRIKNVLFRVQLKFEDDTDKYTRSSARSVRKVILTVK